MIQDLWRRGYHDGIRGINELVIRSQLLGSDRSVCNWGGGNTSMKTEEVDFRGLPVSVLWVKGSGSDLGEATEKSFTALRLSDILLLRDREDMSDEEMVRYLEHCMEQRSHPRASIETLLHAFLPFPHIDHTHPDAIISLCCANNGRHIAEAIFGDRFVWVPYIRPGFTLSKLIADGVKDNPHAELVLMEKHGLVTWGDTSEACYHQTLAVIGEVEAFIEKQKKPTSLPFGGPVCEPLPTSQRHSLLSEILPIIRGAVSQSKKMVLTYDDSEDVLTFVNGQHASSLSQVGAACPDHLVHTKRIPLFVAWQPQTDDVQTLYAAIVEGIAQYEREYEFYFARHAHLTDQITDLAPRVILIPGIGMINTGKSLRHADISRQLYHRAISVMQGATALGTFVSLTEEESFLVEYWPLELYKLTLSPREGELARQVGLVTGGAGGIGSATCRKLAAAGMHVVVADLNFDGASQIASELNDRYGANQVMAVQMDVTKPDQVHDAFLEVIKTFGGIDLIVNNAGLATSTPFEQTSLEEWNLNMDVLATGYFLVAQEAYTIMKRQGIGGAMVFIGSKNSIYAGKNAAAYSTAKAAEIHLARCIAAEGGELGIRVNSVLPDAVLQGSHIWSSAWREERAATYGIKPEELDDYYRKRTVLQEFVFPDDIAEAVLYFASARSAKTTGCMLTVDGGVAAAFTR